MKSIFSTNRSENIVDISILLLRIGIAAFMLTHGLPKLQALSNDPVQFPGVLGMSPSLSLGLTVFAEVICSVFILLGFGTRLAVIPLIITMLVAVFYVHASDPFAKQEMGLLYFLTYVSLLLTGAGKYSADYLISKKTDIKNVHPLIIPSYRTRVP